MQVSPKYKRFKRSYFLGNTFTLPDMRSSIIRTIQGCFQQQNTANLKRFEKEAQNREIWIQKTVKLFSVSDRVLWSNLHLTIKMIKQCLVFYPYEHKYHNKALMNSFSYLCSYVYINVEMWLLMKKYIQLWIHIDILERGKELGLPRVWHFLGYSVSF